MNHTDRSTHRSQLRPATALAALVLLAACGGGYGGGGTTTSNASLAPTITQQPASITVSAGQPASFSVAATSAYTLSYQWRRAGATITGATAASYALPAASAGDNGASFTVVVTDLYGAVESNPATLTVQ